MTYVNNFAGATLTSWEMYVVTRLVIRWECVNSAIRHLLAASIGGNPPTLKPYSSQETEPHQPKLRHPVKHARLYKSTIPKVRSELCSKRSAWSKLVQGMLRTEGKTARPAPRLPPPTHRCSLGRLLPRQPVAAHAPDPQKREVRLVKGGAETGMVNLGVNN
jgi:hypothetical protein